MVIDNKVQLVCNYCILKVRLCLNKKIPQTGLFFRSETKPFGAKEMSYNTVQLLPANF